MGALAMPSRAQTPTPTAETSANSPNPAGKTQTVFIHKLYDMLEDPSLAHLIWWLPTNDSFCLYPGEEFSNVLAQYFKHTNIASFIRQLNMYGFHKVNDSFQGDDKGPHWTPGGTKWEFHHLANQFRKGDVDSLRLIKRKSSKVINSHKEIVSLKLLPPTSNPLEEKPPPAQLQQQYHRSVYQLLWEQLSDSPASPQASSPASYAPPPLAHHYPHHLNGPLPPSPGPPPYPEHQTYIHGPLSLQLLLRHPSTQALAVDQSINLKFMEMTNAINSLRTSYLELLGRYDSLAAAHQRTQSDMLQLADICEKLEDKKPDEKKYEEKKEEIDRSKSMTPVNRVTTPSHDMSPMSVKPLGRPDAKAFKLQLAGRISQPQPQQPQFPQAQPPPSLSHPHTQNYHLNEVSLTLSRIPSNCTIVPQHYPLNPNYTLYPDTRQFRLSSDDLLNQARPSRHFSVLMDPLQPIPARSGAVQHAEEPLKSFSPLSIPPNKEAKHPDYVQQYQPKVQATHYATLRNEPVQQRTVSLPILEKVLPQGQMPQRHSTTTISNPATRLPEPTLPAVRTQSPGGLLSLGATLAPIVKEPTYNPQIPKANTPLREKETKNLLPSVLELDKSIKASGRVYDLLLDLDEDRAKKRRLET